MTAYHSKRGPVEGCPQPDEPIRERAWTDAQKAGRRDERERFEAWAWPRNVVMTWDGGGYTDLATGNLFSAFKAGMRAAIGAKS